MSYREVLKRIYATVDELKENPSEWPTDAVAREVAIIRNALTTAPAGIERDAALRLCSIGERVSALSAPFIERYEKTSPRSEVRARSYEEQARAEKEAVTKEATFKGNIVRQWREQCAPLQAAARATWKSIPETAMLVGSGANAMRAHALEKSSAWQPVIVERVLKEGAFVVPMESFAIASRESRVGMGGNVGTGWRPGSRVIFAKGLTGVAETQRREILSYKDGTHTYRDEFGEVRTVERWAVMRSREE